MATRTAPDLNYGGLKKAEDSYIDEMGNDPILVGSETIEEMRLTTNMYSEIRMRLATRDVPPEEVAFIHDAKTPVDRAALFKAVNEGQIRVLIGSSEKMGTGMNAQTRPVSYTHLTLPTSDLV